MANRLVNMMSTFREVVRNLILGYPSLTNKIFEIFLGEIHKVNPEILGYPRIPGSPLTTSLKRILQLNSEISRKLTILSWDEMMIRQLALSIHSPRFLESLGLPFFLLDW